MPKKPRENEGTITTRSMKTGRFTPHADAPGVVGVARPAVTKEGIVALNHPSTRKSKTKARNMDQVKLTGREAIDPHEEGA
ncbi:MAG: hypothetical protein JNL98_17740 [Bryobacterales bacterium]|nr:hypothetical protein [Bryobacterales bacterium]